MKATSKVLNYEKSGSGPTVVLLHGYLSSLRYWDEIRTSLEKDHTVITLDLLGFGSSPKPKKSYYNYDDHLQWIKRTLDSFDMQEPFILCGHSMGALLALRFSLEYPESVRRLLLMNTPLFKDATEARQQLAGTSLFVRLFLYWGLHRLIIPVMRIGITKKLIRSFLPVNYKGMETYISTSSVESRGRSLRNIIEAQSSLYDLERLNIPTILVQGTMERPMYIENLLRVHAKPGLDILLPETGHHTTVDKPELVSGLMQA
jgi:pimeloyl-ACP methyl ester carboxylesterase